MMNEFDYTEDDRLMAEFEKARQEWLRMGAPLATEEEWQRFLERLRQSE